MKRFMYAYGWIFLVIVFMVAMFCGYKALDQVSGAVDKYEVPDDVRAACEKWGAYYGISPEFLEADYWTESNYKAGAVNKAGTCFGVGQVKETAHRDRMARLGVTNLFDIDQNVHVSADYFAELFEEYEDPALVLMVYHGESDAMWKFDNGIMSGYAEGILDMAWELEERHGKHLPAHFKDLELAWENGKG